MTKEDFLKEVEKYENKRAEFSAALKELKADREKLESEFDKIYDGCNNLKEKIEARKKYSDLLEENVRKQMQNKNKDKTFCLALKICNECIIHLARNYFLETLSENEKMQQVPMTYKKFDNWSKDVLGENFYTAFSNMSNLVIYYRKEYVYQTLYIGRNSFSDDCRKIDTERLMQEKERKYKTLDADKIYAFASDAIGTAGTIKNEIETVKKKISEQTNNFAGFNATYNVMPTLDYRVRY